MSTAPAPDAAAPPGMCPGIAVMGGGGSAGGSDGGGSGGGDGGGDGRGGEGTGASGDQKCAPSGTSDTESASDPVDVVTGRVFTPPVTDLRLPGPIPLEFTRSYSSRAAARDFGLGWGWGHSWGWTIEVRRRSIVVWTEEGISVDFEQPLAVGEETIGPWGYLLRRTASGFVLDIGDGLDRVFASAGPEERRLRLSSIEDGNGNRIELTYHDGALVRVVDSAGRVLRVTPDAGGRIAAIEVLTSPTHDRSLRIASYTHGDDGDLVRVTDAEGHASRYTYDGGHLLVSSTDRVGLTSHYAYDSQRRCVEVWLDHAGKADPCLAEGLPPRLRDGTTVAKGIYHCKLVYGSGGYSEVIDSTTIRRFFGNPMGTLDRSVDGRGVVTRTYDEHGHLLSRTDGLGATTTFERDERGRVLAITDPLGRVTRIERDARGNPVRITDRRGDTVELDRDGRGNVVVHRDGAGAATLYRRDGRGQVVEVASPGGGSWRIERDVHGNQVGAIAPDGARWTWRYDALGRMVARTDPMGRTVRHEYSPLGNLLATQAPEGVTRYAYDAEGYLVRVEDPAGNVRELAWGGYRQLCAAKDQNGNIVRLAYDRDGELVEVHNEVGEVHRLDYDAWHRLVKETTFDGRTFRYRFDEAGRLQSIENGERGWMQLSYDAAGNLVTITRPGSGTETYEHDANGAVIAASSGAGRFTFERDARGRITREEQTVGGVSYAIETTWGAIGGAVARRTSWGHDEAVVRDARGLRRRTSAAAGLLIDHANDPLGREVRRVFSPDGGAVTTAYTPAGQIAARWLTSPARAPRIGRGEPDWVGPLPDAVWGRAYRYDARQELLEVWDRDAGVTRYEHDARGQVIAAWGAVEREERFRYDPSGNIAEASGSGAWSYGPGGRLVRRGDIDYVWDALGRLSERRVRAPSGGELVTRFQWSDRDLLECVLTPEGLRVEFTYDPLARRIGKRVSRRGQGERWIEVATTRYVWDRHRLVHEVTRAGDSERARTYVYEDDEFVPMAHYQHDGDGRWRCYLTDPAGAPDALVNLDGTIAGSIERRVWGRVRPRGSAEAETPLRFQGQYEDPETGLFYNRFRYYDPDTGRYISPDPTGLLGGLNAYRYARNPFRWGDPFGLVVINAGERINDFPDNPDEFILRGHGNSSGMNRPFDDRARQDHRKYMVHDEKELAGYIRNHPDYKPGMTIRLASCKTAKGENSIADRLAAEMAKDGSKVYAPTENLHVGESYSTVFTQNERNDWRYEPGFWREGGTSNVVPGPANHRPSTRELDDKFFEGKGSGSKKKRKSPR
ncbi:RHS repeat-associated core domain-containing protein [Sorangium sp. So ce281]|uniref:RHS repeat-associated core domain-containing protein n=1 Tax=unclassified Sorangium TaxID=2621164 RepID=UPI003F5FE641